MQLKSISIALLLATTSLGSVAQEDVRFDIVRFEVKGNTLLPAANVNEIVAPFIGRKRVYGDVQKALEALENAYRKQGYGTIQVYVPEQELTSGVVQLHVTESVVGKVQINGNQHFDTSNIRASLPSLREGQAPNMRELSENIQLANENPAKQLDVTLGISEWEGQVDAKVAVTEEDPVKYILTFDNTGSATTGNHRVGIAYQNANIANRDQVLTLAYTTAPDAPEGVKVDIFSVAYKIPFYNLGDSLDIIYGKSSVNTPATQATGFNLAGKGDVFALRWNHYFPRRGEYTSRLIVGLDYKYIDARQTTNGVPGNINPPTGNGAFTPHTLRPLSFTYAGQRQGAGQQIDYNLGFYKNLSLGTSYDYTTLQGQSGNDRYTLLGGRKVTNNFHIYKANFSLMQALPDNWSLRLAWSGQYAPTALPTAEQISLSGGTAVRGFGEGVVRMDSGQVVNIEAYTPELSGWLNIPGSFKALAFYDFAHGRNRDTVRPTPETLPVAKASIGTVGVGFRYAYSKALGIKFDLGHVVDAGPVDIRPGTIATFPANTESKGDWRGHFAVQASF